MAAVVFDYGGTLAHFRRPDEALQRAYGAIRDDLLGRGYAPPPVDALLRDVHDRVDHEFAEHCASGSAEEIDLVAAAARAYRDLGFHLSDAELDRFLVLEQEAWWHGVSLDPEALPVIRTLRAQGLRVGLCSNAAYRAASMHAQLVHVGLRNHIDAAVFSGEVGWRKPDSRIFQAVLTALGADAAHTVMVGDSEADDVTGAHRAGLRAILLRREAVTMTHEASRADAVISSLSELTCLLAAVPLHILDVHS